MGAASSRKLADLVRRGVFRDDLYVRLAVVRLALPPLAARREDIPYLVDHFIERFNAKRGKNIQGVTPAVMEILMRHDFPGNVRELENVIEYGFALCHNGLIDTCHLPEELRPAGRVTSRCHDATNMSPLQRAEADAVKAALTRNAGHLGRSAADLGVSRATLWRKMTRYGIDVEAFRA